MDSRTTLWLLPCTWHFGGGPGPCHWTLRSGLRPPARGGKGVLEVPVRILIWLQMDLGSKTVTISKFFQRLVFQCKMEIVMGSVPLSCCEH